MTVVTFQTVRLARGKHRSPQDGACVMELASMLAGERFSDRPASVCRVIAAVLRSYNDAVRNDRRQDLYGCAAKVVGTRASESVERARAAHCLLGIDELRESHETSWWWRRTWGSPGGVAAMRVHTTLDSPPCSGFGLFVGEAFAAARERGHLRLLRLIDELVAIGQEASDGVDAPAPPEPGRGLAPV